MIYYGYDYLPKNDENNDVRDRYYRGHREGYTYTGDGYYDSDTGASGFYEYKDENGEIIRHYDM